LWWTKWRWGMFSPSTSVSPANLHSTKFSIIKITRGRYNTPFSGRRAEWTQYGLHSPLRELKKNSTELSESSELLYDWRFTANQFVLATSSLRPTTRIFIFQLNACGYSSYVTFSLSRGSVCCLQLLLGLASAVIIKPESYGTHDHILLS
jgi:hypothetical protein